MECKSGAKQSRRGRTLPVSAAAALLLAGCMTPVPAPGAPYTVATQTNLAYGPLAAERGDLYLPQGIAAPPVVLVIHGGGWAAGQRASAAGLARLLAMRGLAAFNIDYRLATTASPDTRWPAQIVDAQLAVRWLRAHAATLGIDGQQIAATGDSAGAHLALLLGTLPHSVPGDEAGLFRTRRRMSAPSPTSSARRTWPPCALGHRAVSPAVRHPKPVGANAGRDVGPAGLDPAQRPRADRPGRHGRHRAAGAIASPAGGAAAAGRGGRLRPIPRRARL